MQRRRKEKIKAPLKKEPKFNQHLLLFNLLKLFSKPLQLRIQKSKLNLIKLMRNKKFWIKRKRKQKKSNYDMRKSIYKYNKKIWRIERKLRNRSKLNTVHLQE